MKIFAFPYANSAIVIAAFLLYALLAVMVMPGARAQGDAPTVERITAGKNNVCAHLSDDTLSCWGKNFFGPLINGFFKDSPIPVDNEWIADVEQISEGNANCVLLTNGNVACHPTDWNVEILSRIISFEPIPGVSDIVSISSGGKKSCGIESDGDMICWHNTNQNLPLYPIRHSPSYIQEVTNGSKVSMNGSVGCVLLTDGTVSCWSNPLIVSPNPIEGITDATDVSVGNTHSCALIADGTIKCWGDNSYGQLGDGTTTNSSNPIAVTGITDATDVSVGNTHSCALIADGTIKCWGDNSYGQLGDGTTTNSSNPIAVTGITDATDVSVGNTHSCALIADGTIKCWGDNSYGQLGDGTKISRNTPDFVFGFAGDTPQPPHLAFVDPDHLIAYTNHEFIDSGVFAVDAKDGDITENVIATGTVDTNNPGKYTLSYSVTDSEGLTQSISRNIYVVESDIVDPDGDGLIVVSDQIDQEIQDSGAILTLLTVDADPGVYSDNIFDTWYTAYAMDTFGTILSRGDLFVLVENNEDWDAGVMLTAIDRTGDEPAIVEMCGSTTITLTHGDRVLVTCGSATVDVITGEIEAEMTADNGVISTVTIESGNGMVFRPTDNTIATSGTEPIVATVGGEEVSIAPGETKTLPTIIPTPTPTPTPQPTPTPTPTPNLLTNAGFENDGDWKSGFWTSSKGTIKRVTATKHSGSYSYMIDGDTNTSGGQVYSNTANQVPVTPGTRYRYSAWYQGDNAYLVIKWFNSSGTELTSARNNFGLENTSTWTEAVKEAIAPTGATKAWVFVQSRYNAQPVYFDDLTFFPLDEATPSMVFNPSFETQDGWLKGFWTSSKGTIARVTSPVHSGSYAYMIDGDSSSSGGQVYSDTANKLAVTAGQSYRLSAWYQGKNIYLVIKWLDANGNELTSKRNNIWQPNSTSWRQAIATVTAPTGATKAWLFVQTRDNAEPAYFDDIGFEVAQ